MVENQQERRTMSLVGARVALWSGVGPCGILSGAQVSPGRWLPHLDPHAFQELHADLGAVLYRHATGMAV